MSSFLHSGKGLLEAKSKLLAIVHGNCDGYINQLAENTALLTDCIAGCNTRGNT